MNFSTKIINWYSQNKRDLPWRGTEDPYKIWISEIILQQTRVAQGIEYYLRFTEVFPDVRSLAAAEIDEVLKLWQGLGYYSRARHLHEAARQLMRDNRGQLPGSYDELIRIRGIGEYSAAAIASIAFNQSVPLVDGNVFRVISRLFMVGLPKGSTDAKNRVRKIAGEILNPEHPGLHNQAIMEFGAIQCIPKNPDCTVCIFRTTCKSYRNGKVEEYPVAGKKAKIRDRFFNYLFIRLGKNTVIRKREGTDIWKGLYEFPLIETSTDILTHKLYLSTDWKSLFAGVQPVVLSVSDSCIHLLSHQRIHARLYFITIDSLSPLLREEYLSVPITELHKYPVPKLIDRFLDES